MSVLVDKLLHIKLDVVGLSEVRLSEEQKGFIADMHFIEKGSLKLVDRKMEYVFHYVEFSKGI